MATSRPGAPLLAYVLHRHDWSESSLIVELFTRAQGRMAVVAKGAKRPTSQLRPVLLPFQPVHALLGRTAADSQAEVHLLRSAEWVGGQPLLKAPNLLPAFYLNELLLKLLARHDAHPALFDAYADTLAALASGGDEAVALRAFEFLLLRELGVLPELGTATLLAEPVRAQARYTLHPEAGVLDDAQGLPGPLWVALEAALGGADVATVQGRTQARMQALRQACTPVAAALRGPLRGMLHYHLGHAPLHTRHVWRGVQRLAASVPVPNRHDEPPDRP
jgi:DNA repair protein RecO (recombination protein O)